MAYGFFANVYDKLMADFDYEKYSSLLLSLFEKYDVRPRLMLDLACGTGEISHCFMNEGIDVIAVDMSPQMLQIAKEKTPNLLCLCQSADELDLFGTVDGAICTLDSINHIIDETELENAFKKVSLFLEKERLFIFDVNSIFKHNVVLGNNTFVFEEENVFCTWQNETENNVTEITLDFFVEQNGKYIRNSEYITERAYCHEQLMSMFKKANLELVDFLDFETLEKPSDTAERIIYIVRKK